MHRKNLLWAPSWHKVIISSELSWDLWWTALPGSWWWRRRPRRCCSSRAQPWYRRCTAGLPGESPCRSWRTWRSRWSQWSTDIRKPLYNIDDTSNFGWITTYYLLILRLVKCCKEVPWKQPSWGFHWEKQDICSMWMFQVGRSVLVCHWKLI